MTFKFVKNVKCSRSRKFSIHVKFSIFEIEIVCRTFIIFGMAFAANDISYKRRHIAVFFATFHSAKRQLLYARNFVQPFRYQIDISRLTSHKNIPQENVDETQKLHFQFIFVQENTKMVNLFLFATVASCLT